MVSSPVPGIIIAGGQSRRLGQDKRNLRLWGQDKPTLLEHTVSVLSPMCNEVIVVLNDPENWRGLPAQLVSDVLPNCGVLGGLYSGLVVATHQHALVVGADMPFLNADLLATMLAYPRNYDALVPRSEKAHKTRNALNAETLHAVYSRNCLELLQNRLKQGLRSIADFLNEIEITFVESRVVSTYDHNGYSFLNINTPDDLEHVAQLIRMFQSTSSQHLSG